MERVNQTEGGFDPQKINHDPALVALLVECAINVMEETVYDDGIAMVATSFVETLERALHNVYRPYRPSYPDSQTSVACIYPDCQWCKDNDANCGSGGPPYDAATATGMYDRDC